MPAFATAVRRPRHPVAHPPPRPAGARAGEGMDDRFSRGSNLHPASAEMTSFMAAPSRPERECFYDWRF